MNKRKRILLIILPSAFILFLISGLFFTASQVKISGKNKITLIANSGNTPDFIINTTGIFGSKQEIVSNIGVAYLEGYYKDVNLEVESAVSENIASVEVRDYENKELFQDSEFNFSINGTKAIILDLDLNQNKSLLKVCFEIVLTELSKPWMLDFILLVCIILVLVAMFFIVKKVKKNKLASNKSIFKNILTNLIVFVSGLLFWIIVFLLLLEISLRIIGYFYSEKPANAYLSNDDNKFVVLCIGDSFTYGIGSTKDNNYPVQLQKLLQKHTDKEVVVINRGRCAQNTTQTIEKLQDDLSTFKPDVVIMLFGMANSWNYYGFETSDNYWERIRVVKLYRRIKNNLKFRGASSDTDQNVYHYAFSFLQKSNVYSEFGETAFYRYYFAGRYYLALRDWKNSFKLLSFSLHLDQNNIECFNSLIVALEEFDNENRLNYLEDQEQTDGLNQIVEILNSFVSQYPDDEIFKYLKAIYLIDKNYSLINYEALQYRRKQISVSFDYSFVNEVEKSFVYNHDSLLNFYTDLSNYENQEKVDLMIAWLNIQNQNFSEARILLNNLPTLKDSISADLYSVANLLIRIQSGEQVSDLIDSNDEIDAYIKANFSSMLENCGNKEEFAFGIRQIFNYVVLKSCDYDNMYFLPHKLKRSASIEQSKVFDWIASDIDKAVQICLKQNYPVICMNYPIIPPPNSEEISFWADSVGKIWFYTAKKYNLPFIDNDSAFKSKGTEQNTYFEPHSTGSEHCSNKGYGLIASNICELLLRKDVLK